jgi:hypothetical protein
VGLRRTLLLESAGAGLPKLMRLHYCPIRGAEKPFALQFARIVRGLGDFSN